MRLSSTILSLTILLLPFYIVAQGLIIPSGGYVIAGNGNIVTKNNFVNNGSFTHNGGTVIFNGTTQTLAGTTATTFNNLTIITGSTTTISSAGHMLKNVLLSNGTLHANGNLTLLSTAAQTAAIDGTGTGSVSGNITMQRYIASGFGYKYFSSPFQADTVGDFSNDINLAASFPALYRHDENLTSIGWLSYTTGAGLLNPLHGYAANLGASMAAKTVDLTGVVNNGTVSRTLYNHNMAYTQGFNFVGNPYPSPINWNAASGWTKTNIDNAVYYFNAGTLNQYTGVYSSYVNGVSSDGIAGSTIAAMQGFFVHVSNGAFPVTATLGVTNSVRTLNSNATFFKVSNQDDKPLLRLSAGFAEQTGIADPVVVYFDEGGTDHFNTTLDALKLMNSDSLVPNLYTVSLDAQKLSIRALAAANDTLAVIPLTLSIVKDGALRFYAKDIHNIPPRFYIYFNDTKTGVNHDLRKDAVYSLPLVSGAYTNRFFLKFSTRDLNAVIEKPITGADGIFKAYSSGSTLFVNAGLAAGEKANLTVINTLGQIVYRQQISGNSDIPVSGHFASGVYIVSIATANKKQSKKIFIANK